MAASEIAIFRASLSAKVYREFEIQGAKKLCDLASAIVEMFGFDFDHAYGFYSNSTGNIYRSPVRYELFADMGESDAGSVKKTRIDRAFPDKGAKMTFVFDYGDEWRFKIERIGEAAKQPKAKYPNIVKSVGEAPEQYPDYEDD